ncbi:DUF692 family multinuclear iron-containing protein [Massilia sp. PWRC2]|uniref:MNIO family bufferin maturase n=1 Tax=Massilia sp. PWRC2 TaxID=2804626 RepID=UPI003CF9BEF7
MPKPMFAGGVGVGLRAPHYREFLQAPQRAVDWLEVHAENYLHLSGWDGHVLQRLRRDYPVSLHGVGLGLGSVHGFSSAHLERLRRLAGRIEPVLISEHLSWSALAEQQLCDLLPLPLARSAFDLLVCRIDQVQQALGRTILLENVSTYVRYHADAMSEAQFLAELARRTGCGVLLDLNNLYVNQCNHGEDALSAIATLARLAPGAVAEIHLAGHLVTPVALVDHHGAPVCAAVWELYGAALRAFGPTPTLIEWDTDIPALSVLLAEADKARALAATLTDARPVSTWRTDAAAPAWPSTSTGLAASQRQFAAALRDAAAADISSFAGSQVSQRLAMYRGQQRGTWHKTLAAAFPVLQQLVGDEFFAGASAAFGLAQPPREADLNAFGAAFPDFLANFAPAADYPYLADMGRLEWALHCAYFADDAVAVSALDLAGWTPQRFDDARFVLAPAVTLMAAPWPLASLWHAHHGGPWPSTMAASEQWVVARPRWQATLTPLTLASLAALRSVQQGTTMGVAIDAALALDAGFDLGAALAQWLSLGLLVQRQHATC